MLTKLKSMLSSKTPQRIAYPRLRLREAAWPAVVYAVGDIHGCLDQLKRLEAKIVEDAAGFAGERIIVTLGDYIDRGPDSSGVLDYLTSPPPAGFRRVCLAGNHDVLMSDFINQPQDMDDWMHLGGDLTLRSYGVQPSRLAAMGETARRSLLLNHIPRRHSDFLEHLPLTFELPGVVFVHAGVRPGIAVEAQKEVDLLWMRPDAAEDALRTDGLVVHGHTPVAAPVLTAHRVCVDTAVFATGTLTAIRLGRDSSYRIIQT